ncbi:MULTISPECIES: hypothetical protein [unclassified Curtobacterium]|uniref:hypothetical protein n=1 Tax=unclassified Curtobacterium TaxID=257496 RepID=UPI0011B69BD7|nr:MULTISPECIES: hypothetical protein [unclassified Curtobacterium]
MIIAALTAVPASGLNASAAGGAGNSTASTKALSIVNEKHFAEQQRTTFHAEVGGELYESPTPRSAPGRSSAS